MCYGQIFVKRSHYSYLTRPLLSRVSCFEFGGWEKIDYGLSP